MEHTFLAVSIILLFTVKVFCQEPRSDFTDKIAVTDMKSAYARLNFKESQNAGLYNLIYQRMKWKIDPNVRYISGSVTSYFKSKTDDFRQVEFDLERTMAIDSVLQNGIKVTYSRNGNKFTVQLMKPLAAGKIDSLTVFYSGAPVNSAFGSFTRTTHQGVPVLWTLSEPYGAIDWWPCKQTLSDKIDSVDIIVTSPETYRTASNGVLVSEKVASGFRTMHWRHRYPIATYLVAIAVTNYVSYSDYLYYKDGRKLEVLNFVYPEYLSTAKINTPQTVDMIALYNRLIGEYPFSKEKYGHAQFGWGGGMEHQTMSFMVNFDFELVAHELAHQWFGDYITLGSWQDIFLNEGFATYLSGLAYENLLGGKWWPQFKRVNLNRIVSSPGGSVFVRDTTNINTLFSSRLSYSKGAYLLHMLRWIMGDQNFFRGIQNYFNDPAVANGFARTHQFVKHMEAVGDTSLNEFFKDWYYGEGYPSYSARFVNSINNELKIILSQTPSHSSVSFFEMPVPVRVYSAGKKDSADFRLLNTSQNQEFLVKPGFQVSELKIDPDMWLISKTLQVTKAEFYDNPNEYAIYPNPFDNAIFINMFSGKPAEEISLFSTNGQAICLLNPMQTIFPLENLANGIYIVRIKTRDKVYEEKIIKLRR